MIHTGNQVIKINETFSSIFQRTFGKPIDYEGRSVCQIYVKKIQLGVNKIKISRLNASLETEVGLRLKVVKGELEINGERSSDFVLWSDTCPEVVNVSVFAKKGCELRVWNVWRAGDVVQAWVGNSGIILSEEHDGVVLECSDGAGDIDFSSLIVKIFDIG
ncbi:hypothetical protein V0R50_31075 [Pseudomonas sp. 148P]|uniref:Uncharacterized protein n=1 Tax=Pseudomonas ulcerans TaxID=3115852 RepID=A0ABU7I1J0_9PSED|nr:MULTISPECIES: hypothetical protein [unclassified Pseudomonas]MEE1926463.1 hypothetical protein [Pseudomonas sp. 147P]MEE1937687.1 hypothetical protein [Pseudomonas sp. 148P]